MVLPDRPGAVLLRWQGGTTALEQYYCTYNRCRCRSTRHEKCPPRVEAVVARYRSGTAAEDPQAVLPLGTAVLHWG